MLINPKRSRRLSTYAYLALLFMVLLAASQAFAHEMETESLTDASGKWRYILTANGATITSFEDDEGTEMVVIPNKLDGHTVTTIGEHAFANNHGVIGVEIPWGIIRIEDKAFDYCESLQYVLIPETVTYIEGNPFVNCPLPWLSVSKDNPVFEVVEGVLFNKEEKILITAQGVRKKDYAVPEGTLHIGKYAFQENEDLQSVTLPDSLVGIGESAFSYCIGLTGLSVPDSVQHIGESAFSNCERLTSVNIPDGIEYISDYAFSGCGSLTDITIPDGVVRIGAGAFIYCESLTDMIIPDSVVSIESDAFWGCDSLTSLLIPESVEDIGMGAFSYCQNLKSVTLPESLELISEGLFEECSLLSNVNLPGSLSEIGSEAFSGCELLPNVNLPDSITYIGEYAFANCRRLTEVTIPGSVKSIGANAFLNCTGLTSATLEQGVESIQSNAFYGCIALQSVSIPASVIDIGQDAFNDCPIVSINLSNGNPVYALHDDALLNQDQKILLLYLGAGEYTVPEGTLQIAPNAFRGSKVTAVTLPESLKSIGDFAFSGCNELTGVVIPNHVEYIGDNAFSQCASLTSVIIPDSVFGISHTAFYGSNGLTGENAPNIKSSISPTTGMRYPVERDYAYRPVLVEISNSYQSRPHFAMSLADIVYEYVYWGPHHTRYLALYNDCHPEMVGMIRSSRTIGMALRNSWDCPIVFAGGQLDDGTSIRDYNEDHNTPWPMLFDSTAYYDAESESEKAEFGQAYEDDYEATYGKQSVFSRYELRYSPHNLLSYVRKLVWEHWPSDENGEAYEPALPTLRFSENHSSGDAAGKEIIVSYDGLWQEEENTVAQDSELGYCPSYRYDAAKGHYKRWYNNAPQIDGLTGQEIIADNIIVLYAELTYYNDLNSRPLWNLTGEGLLDVFIAGQHMEGTWKRTDDDSQFEYFDESGNELLLKPGKTFIQIVPEEMKIVYN